jgi:dCTP deaminase
MDYATKIIKRHFCPVRSFNAIIVSMFLSDRDIHDALRAGDITLTPFVREQLQPASYDISLGTSVMVPITHTSSAVDPQKNALLEYTRLELASHEPFVLHQGMSVLCYSRERVGSDKYLIEVKSKSSLARVGLFIHNASGIVNPGHYLNIELSLTNLHMVPILLRAGMGIAQLTFSPLSSESGSKYQGTSFSAVGGMLRYAPPRSGPLARARKKK